MPVMTDAPNFSGLRVAAFESRRADDMARLIERSGGRPSVSPSMREVPLERNPEAIDFAHQVMTGQIDVIIFMTGVGVRHLMAQVERHVDAPRFLTVVSDLTTVVRGPKPVVVLKELGIEPTHRVPEPNTWREVLQTIDRHVPLANQSVGLQEYGEPNASLIAGLEARGARVVNVKVYNWDLPDDTAPLEENIRAIVAGRIDVVLFTSSHQVANLLRMAQQIGLLDQLRGALDRIAIASIGPTTSEGLREHGLTPDIEPEHPKMGQLVAAAADHAVRVMRQKQARLPTAQRRPSAQ